MAGRRCRHPLQFKTSVMKLVSSRLHQDCGRAHAALSKSALSPASGIIYYLSPLGAVLAWFLPGTRPIIRRLACALSDVLGMSLSKLSECHKTVNIII